MSELNADVGDGLMPHVNAKLPASHSVEIDVDFRCENFSVANEGWCVLRAEPNASRVARWGGRGTLRGVESGNERWEDGWYECGDFRWAWCGWEGGGLR